MMVDGGNPEIWGVIFVSGKCQGGKIDELEYGGYGDFFLKCVSDLVDHSEPTFWQFLV